MLTAVVKTPSQRAAMLHALAARDLPLLVTVEKMDPKGRRRSAQQNRLQRLWLNEAAAQLKEESTEELRGYCKLVFGVPILRAEDEEFRAKYDAKIRGLPYETKLALMMEPFDMPVTRLMSVDQKTRFLELMARYLLQRGAVLTEPDPMMRAA